MPETRKTFYLTTPIYYVNARPHIGHAYSTIVADVLARRHRLLGDDTYFLTGTDEHGQKIERAAAAAGIPPQQYADQVSQTFSDLWARMGITHDQFIRTTRDGHKQGAQKLFADLYARGQIYLSSYTGQYSVGEEMFVEGPPGTIGPDGKPTETVTEENFFFRLSDYQEQLIDLIESNELIITPESSRNEVLRFLCGDLKPVIDEYSQLDKEDTDAESIEGGDSEFVPTEKGVLPALAWGVTSGRLGLSRARSAFVPGALRDLSVSRSSFTWGIPVPEPAASETKQRHVIYVWLDALANYMTALGYGALKEDGSEDDTLWQKFWPADIHLVGKEITRFHCVYWPAFLLAAGLPLPKQVTANGWLLFDNSKMSKSRGNVVRTETILDAFGTLCPPPKPPAPATDQVPQGFSLGSHSSEKEKGALAPGTALKGTGFSPSVDAQKSDAALAAEGNVARPSKADRDLFAADILRYYLLREIPFGQDGSFSFDSLITRYNADLANGYGNLVSRTLAMIEQYFDGFIPFGTMDYDVSVGINLAVAANTNNFIDLDFSSLLENVMLMVKLADGHLTKTTPWKLAKDPARKQELTDSLYTAVETIRIVTAQLEPILPYATAKIFFSLGIPRAPGAEPTWSATKLGPLSPIFPRADKGLAQIMTDMENPDTQQRPDAPLKSATTPAPAAPIPTDSTHPAAGPRTPSLDEPSGTLTVAGSTSTTTHNGPTPSHTEAQVSGIFATQPAAEATNQITIDDFIKIELRVAQIVLAERIPKADKLLRLEVDLGPEGRRQILSGIAEWYTPEDLLDRKIVVITNLAPRKMRGLDSHGMLLAASEEGGKPVLATFGEDIPNGTRLK